MAAIITLTGVTPMANVQATSLSETASYTYIDMNKIMYATSVVNVRDLPAIDGVIVGTLVQNQAVTVTGRCNETGWYRIAYNNTESYVSDKYLSETQIDTNSKVAVVTDTYTGITHSVNADVIANMNANAIVNRMSLSQQVFLSLFLDTNNAIVADNGTIVDSSGQIIAYINEIGAIVSVGPDDYAKDLEWLWAFEPDTDYSARLNRAIAEEIWGYMNAERMEAGLNPIAWDEDIYNFACKRAQALVTDFSHNGCEPYGENIAACPNSAYLMHIGWYNSPGHHANYMNPNYTKGACAVYEYEHDGYMYGVENFMY